MIHSIRKYDFILKTPSLRLGSVGESTCCFEGDPTLIDRVLVGKKTKLDLFDV